MRTVDRDPAENAALLGCSNEEAWEGVRQLCCRCVGVAIRQQAQSPHLLLGQPFQKGGDRIDGNGENRGGIFLRRDFDERLEIAQLQCDGIPTDHVGRIGEALRGFEFVLRVNDLRATFTLRFRLTRDGPLHLLRQVYILDFHGGDFDAPRFRLLIDDPLEIRIDLFPFREKVIELALSQYATERGLRHHGCGMQVVFHLDDRAFLVHHRK